MFAVPDAARTACWINAWVTGRASADDVIAGLRGRFADVDFRGLSHSGSLAPALMLGELRRLGVSRASLALPDPGDPVGLGGPAAFNAAAVEHGGAVLLHDASIGLIPRRTSSSLSWLGTTASAPSYLPDIATADRELRESFRTVTEKLVDMDVTSWNPDIADALMNLRAPTQLDTEMAFASPQAARTTIAALRALHIVDLALHDESGAVTAAEIRMRNAALAPLSHAGRTAVVAACSSVDGR